MSRWWGVFLDYSAAHASSHFAPYFLDRLEAFLVHSKCVFNLLEYTWLDGIVDRDFQFSNYNATLFSFCEIHFVYRFTSQDLNVLFISLVWLYVGDIFAKIMYQGFWLWPLYSDVPFFEHTVWRSPVIFQRLYSEFFELAKQNLR